jgi:hypothetical protein
MRTFDSLELKSLLPSDDQILEFGSLAFILTLIGIIFAGASGKIVIWFDLNDVFLTLGIFFPTFIAIFLSVLYKSDPTALYIIWGLAILLGGICAIKSLIQSVGHNHNVFIGVLVWVFKVLVSVITLILVLCRVVLALYGTGNSPNSRRPTTVFQIVIIGLFGYLMWSLVNGKRVYANKGWLVEEQPA